MNDPASRRAAALDDDQPIGRLLSRREIIAGFCAGGFTLMTSCARGADATEATLPELIPGCAARPAQTEGPFFVDERLERSDIRGDSPDGPPVAGVPLVLTLRIARLAPGGCVALPGTLVDLWNCDAEGRYSGVADDPPAPHSRFLRGCQRTDRHGTVRFTTIVPGWYDGRTVHLHLKLRGVDARGRAFTFTTQLYLDDAFIDRVHRQPAYAARGPRPVRNADDSIFADGGDELLVSALLDERGAAATFGIALAVA